MLIYTKNITKETFQKIHFPIKQKPLFQRLPSQCNHKISTWEEWFRDFQHVVHQFHIFVFVLCGFVLVIVFVFVPCLYILYLISSMSPAGVHLLLPTRLPIGYHAPLPGMRVQGMCVQHVLETDKLYDELALHRPIIDMWMPFQCTHQQLHSLLLTSWHNCSKIAMLFKLRFFSQTY